MTYNMIYTPTVTYNTPTSRDYDMNTKQMREEFEVEYPLHDGIKYSAENNSYATKNPYQSGADFQAYRQSIAWETWQLCCNKYAAFDSCRISKGYQPFKTGKSPQDPPRFK